jgi:hypothetical protein
MDDPLSGIFSKNRKWTLETVKECYNVIKKGLGWFIMFLKYIERKMEKSLYCVLPIPKLAMILPEGLLTMKKLTGVLGRR